MYGFLFLTDFDCLDRFDCFDCFDPPLLEVSLVFDGLIISFSRTYSYLISSCFSCFLISYILTLTSTPLFSKEYKNFDISASFSVIALYSSSMYTFSTTISFNYEMCDFSQSKVIYSFLFCVYSVFVTDFLLVFNCDVCLFLLPDGSLFFMLMFELFKFD